jgi:hypothetical protein
MRIFRNAPGDLIIDWGFETNTGSQYVRYNYAGGVGEPETKTTMANDGTLVHHVDQDLWAPVHESEQIVSGLANQTVHSIDPCGVSGPLGQK